VGGADLEVIASHRGALFDIPAWAEDMGHLLVELCEDGNEFHLVIQNGDG
jgi:TusA-related sulfurtransferase